MIKTKENELSSLDQSENLSSAEAYLVTRQQDLENAKSNSDDAQKKYSEFGKSMAIVNGQLQVLLENVPAEYRDEKTFGMKLVY